MKPCLPLQLDRFAIRAGGKAEGRLLIADLNLKVHSGQRWVVLGPNGAGKSTLLLALAGLLPPNSGDIRLDGRPLHSWNARALARERAWCPQFWLDPFPVSAWETVACALLATQPEQAASSAETLARQCLKHFDVASLADTDVRSLSGGERQRVALATAFAQGTPILLLDEPCSHLDWSHQALLHRQLQRHSERGGAVLAAVHDLNLAWTLATHALLLDGKGGTIHGPRDAVLQSKTLSTVYDVEITSHDTNGRRAFQVDLENPK